VARLTQPQGEGALDVIDNAHSEPELAVLLPESAPEGRGPRSERDRGGTALTVMFVLVLVVGLALRGLVLRTSMARQNSDTSVVYLMARHAAQGDMRPFFWGQQYGGTLIQLTAGALFLVVKPDFVALQLVEIGFWLAACVLLRSVVAAGCGTDAGNIAGALFWLASRFLVKMSFSDPGFYGSGLVLGLAAIRLAQAARDRVNVRTAGAMGLCLGLALWTTPFALALGGPAALWFVARIRSKWPALVGLGALVAGAGPWLWANMHTGVASLEPLAQTDSGCVARLVRVFTWLVPAMAGCPPASPQGWVIAGLAVISVVGGIIVAAWKPNPTLAVLSLSAVLVALVVVAADVSVVPAAGRYAIFLLPAVLGVLGCLFGRRPVPAAFVVALVALLTVRSVWQTTDGLRPVPEPAIGVETSELARYLEQQGRTAVWADYWESYLLSAATDERIRAAALAPPQYRREPSYEVAASQAPQTTLVLFAGRENDATLQRQRDLPAHRRTLVGPFAVWVFDVRFDPRFLTSLS
jgi:hypothetical protein